VAILIEAVWPLAFVPPHRAIWPGIDSPENSARRVQLVHRKRFPRLCVLMNPYPAGRSIHPDLAGDILEKNFFSCGPDCSGGNTGGESASPSVDEPAHAHIHRRAQRQKRKQHRGSAVTH
jgi:hypothetical protein